MQGGQGDRSRSDSVLHARACAQRVNKGQGRWSRKTHIIITFAPRHISVVSAVLVWFLCGLLDFDLNLGPHRGDYLRHDERRFIPGNSRGEDISESTIQLISVSSYWSD